MDIIKRRMLIFSLLLALFLSFPVGSAQNPPSSMHLSGMGAKTLGPFDVIEGTLRIHIGTHTDCQACYFGLSILEDNNLDGEYSTDDGDDYINSVWSAGYTDIQNADLWVNHSVSASRIKVAVDTGSSVEWDLVIEQHPEPSHSIEVGVFEDGTEDYIFDAVVTIVDDEGRKYSTGENSLYGYHHYYFNRSFYGYRNYTVVVSAPGYASKTIKITPEDWLSLGFPHWPLYKKVYLRQSSNDAVIYCKVREKGSKVPVKGATVTLQDLTGRGVSTATADSDGLCRFEGLTEGTYELTASAKGFKEETKQAEALSSSTVEQVLFELERSAPGIYGTVKDSEIGNPVANITVELTTYGGDEILDTTKTDAEGFYTFPELKPGDYGVDVSNDILSNQPDERFYEPNGRIARLKGTEYKRIDFALKPKGVDITAGFDVVPGAKQNVTVGNNYSVDVVVSNNGPKDASKVNLEIELKDLTGSGAEFLDALPSDGSCGMSGSSVSCSLGKIKKNGVKSVRLILKTMKRGNFTLKTFGAESPVKDWEKKDWLPINNKDNMTVEVKPYRIYGKAVTPKPNPFVFLSPAGKADYLPLRDIEVNISLNDGKENHTVFTEKDGGYSLTINSSGKNNFQLIASLKSSDNVLDIRSKKGFNKSTVVLKTVRFNMTGSSSNLDLIFSPFYLYLDPSMSHNQSSVLQDAGVFYYNVRDAAVFANKTLKVNFNHRLPVEVYIYEPGCGACYYGSDSHIQIRNTSADSSVWSADSPDNREYHEFGHHINTDSKMGGENNIPTLSALGDENHRGAWNSNSLDSVEEGFAEFFSLMVKGNPQYRWGGTVTNLQRNFHLWLNSSTKKPIIYKNHGNQTDPIEEFNVASLLWDLVDNDKEKGDFISLGAEKTWAVLNSPNITTVRSIYLAFNRTIGRNDTNKTDGLSDLDVLFVEHKFFYDRDRDRVWDPNETIGYADIMNLTWINSPRSDKPRIPGTALEFLVVDEGGSEVDARFFNVSVEFDEERDSFSYYTWPDPGDNSLWVVVPMDARKVEITPVAAGYSAEPFVQKPDEFWSAVKEAQQNNQSVYATHEFKVRENGVPSPDGLKADRINETAVRLLWNQQGNFILVRGIDHRPTYPDDGETVFEGTGTEHVDSGLLTGVTYYYTLFRVKDGMVSKGVSVSLETEIVQPLLENANAPKPEKKPPVNESEPPLRTAMPDGGEAPTRSPLYLLLLLAILAALILWYWRRRKE